MSTPAQNDVRPAADVAVPFGCDRRTTELKDGFQWSALERRSGRDRRGVEKRRHHERRSGRERRSAERVRAEAHHRDRRTAERRCGEGRRGRYFRDKLTAFAHDNKEAVARLLPPDDVVTTRDYDCSRRSPRVYQVHAYDRGGYIGAYPVYRNEVDSSYLCTCAGFILQLPGDTGSCVHVRRVEQFTGRPSA